jgi:hypothetical protein
MLEDDAAAAVADEPVALSKPTTRKRKALEDTSNEEPQSKRPRAPLLSAAAIAQSFRPQYTTRTRSRPSDQENILL